MTAVAQVAPGRLSSPPGTGRIRTMVLFDWNGTIVLDADRARNALNGVLAGHGIEPVTEAAFPASFRLPMADMFAELGVPTNSHMAAEDEWNTRMATTVTRLRQGVSDTLAQLAADGVWLGIVSAASAEAVSHDRNSLEVPDVWSVVLAPAQDKVTILRALRHHADKAVYVGDTAYDMRCAIAAGYIPIGVSGGYGSVEALREAGAAEIIDDLTELTDAVRGPRTPDPTGGVHFPL